jgi:hypothetical protein
MPFSAPFPMTLAMIAPHINRSGLAIPARPGPTRPDPTLLRRFNIMMFRALKTHPQD